VPNFLETLDYQASEMAAEKVLQRRPSEYFPTNFYATFWFERRRLTDTIRAIGVENVMFETDFPHPTCLMPIDDVDQAMDGLTYDEKDKVFNGNAGRVYNISV
jgi:predicted TIM-barrel fold metal-dependent hydrolase